MKKPVIPMPAQNPVSPTKTLGFRPKLRYKKVTGGSLHFLNAIIKPNQTILVFPEDIPAQYLKDFICLDSPELQDAAKIENERFIGKEVLYTVKKTKIKGKYDVLNSFTGKPINEKKLEKAEAEKLRDSLNT